MTRHCHLIEALEHLLHPANVLRILERVAARVQHPLPRAAACSICLGRTP